MACAKQRSQVPLSLPRDRKASGSVHVHVHVHVCAAVETLLNVGGRHRLGSPVPLKPVIVHVLVAGVKYEVNGGCVVEVVVHVHCAPVQVHVAGHLTHTSLDIPRFFFGRGRLDRPGCIFLFSLSWNNGHVCLYEWASM